MAPPNPDMTQATPTDKPTRIPRFTMTQNAVPGLFVKKLGSDAAHTPRLTPHRDDYLLSIFITRGEAVVTVDFSELTVAAGEALLVMPAQVHSPSRATADTEGWLLGISPEHLSAQQNDTLAKYSLHTRPVRLTRETADDMDALLHILSRNIGRHAAALGIASAINGIIIDSIGSTAESSSGRYMAIALEFSKLLAAHMATDKRPSQYAAMLSISPVYLNEAITAVTGMSTTRFIRNSIIVKAKRQLTYTSLSAGEIAQSLGYDDYAYFSRLFRMETGLSPTQFRKNLQGG